MRKAKGRLNEGMRIIELLESKVFLFLFSYHKCVSNPTTHVRISIA
jgi:hypothetical protein